MKSKLSSQIKGLKFYIITVVWGEAYTDIFLNLSLPTQLASGNLPALRYADKAIYAIYTAFKDAETIKKSPIYSVLASIINTKIELIDDIDISQNKMVALNECHKRGIVEGNRDNSVLVFMPPDSIWADGSFTNLIKVADSNKKAVLSNILDVTKETFITSFLHQFTPNKDLSISVAPRELVKLSLEHLHPLYKAWMWDAKEYCYPPYTPHIYWRVDREGLLGKGFHIHPLLVNPVRKDVVPSCAIDVDYIHNACPNIDDIYVVEDSDDILFSGLRFYNQNSEDLKPYSWKNGKNVQNIAFLAAKIDNVRYYYHIFKSNTRIHQGELSSEWGKIEKEADRIVENIGNLLPILIGYVNLQFKLIAVSAYIQAYIQKLALILMGREKIQDTNLYQKLISKFGRS